ncbi:alpha/beta hydrolase [Burkholderia oklahomensis]|uniref:alpha/beta hydrolase n=1 Tax=Burkholderia oklahomensis TaxID=342113 RepID=UPI00016A8DB3|nr:alpha/beta hydrolase [Burkholderia oklahomensis]AJX35682.1 fluoroacetate dehalogenase [Burkholderia oklahomensis C6786]AOI49327.1 hydrolase [Burkholderia oklahomensis C6786]KUY60626.1 hydrolase [Burkholderia oklahomensis C6786]MBI0362421.1 alpha/beta hydrolase [Burkholderia oklahomensis]SUY26530.1 Fluoroacetate dehalogenase [Burkholderia oklahomensis]
MASEVERTAADDFFPGFAGLDIETGDVSFRGRIGGTGSPVLLLHGYPQTHVAWRLIAPTLAKSRTVIVPDLPGYGGSRTHNDLPRWTKRRVAGALVALMDRLGHERFAVIGHDRGARAGYRLALDHPQRVAAYVSLTVVPTLDTFAGVDMTFALDAWHWFFLAQPADLPERMLAADPDAYIDAALAKMAGGLERIDPLALDAYRTAFRNPDVRHAMCEDYRAAASEDLEHDASDFAAGRKLACPTLVLWSEREQKARNTSPIDTWSGWAANATGGGLPGGHLLPEDAPNEVLSALGRFLIDGF